MTIGGENQPDRFVEPFAGGASIALQLAHERRVDHVLLADLDDLVYSFWQTAAFDISCSR